MIAELRRIAQETAQRAFHELCEDYYARQRAGGDPVWNQRLLARYLAAERALDQIDALIEQMQRNDPQAPDYFAVWSEAEQRAAWGDR